MKIKPFFIILILMLFSSCNKERTLHIKAINAVTGDPYSGLSYSVVEEKTGMNGEEFTTVESGTLNSSGEAFPLVKIRKNRSYSIYVSDPDNTCYNKKMNYSYAIQDDENPTFLFEFAECAHLTLSVNNINCQGTDDRILFDLQPNYIIDYSNIIPTEEFGCYSNQFIESEVPYGPWYATWEVTKNGITTYHDSLFTIGVGEHYLFTINY